MLQRQSRGIDRFSAKGAVHQTFAPCGHNRPQQLAVIPPVQPRPDKPPQQKRRRRQPRPRQIRLDLHLSAARKPNHPAPQRQPLRPAPEHDGNLHRLKPQRLTQNRVQVPLPKPGRQSDPARLHRQFHQRALGQFSTQPQPLGRKVRPALRLQHRPVKDAPPAFRPRGRGGDLIPCQALQRRCKLGAARRLRRNRPCKQPQKSDLTEHRHGSIRSRR